MIFTEADLLEREAKHPKLDVRAIAADLERWAVDKSVHAPLKLLDSWIGSSGSGKRYVKAEAGPAATWMRHADGSPLSEIERLNLDAFRLERGEIPAIQLESPQSDPGYAAFRMALIGQILQHSLPPRAVAEILAEHAAKFAELPGVLDLLDAEIAELRARGDDWRVPEEARR